MLLDGLAHGGVAEADLMDAVAVKIEEPSPTQIFEIGTLAGSERVPARRRESLVKKQATVVVDELPGLRVELVQPRLPSLRRVQIPLARIDGLRLGVF